MIVIVGTAAQEAIRIAEDYLPDAPMEKRSNLALEILKAIHLCEAEQAELIFKGFQAVLKKAG